MIEMQSEMDAMNDPAMKDHKDMAMKHMEMAKASMKEGKMDDWSMHTGEASKDMMKKLYPRKAGGKNLSLLSAD